VPNYIVHYNTSPFSFFIIFRKNRQLYKNCLTLIFFLYLSHYKCEDTLYSMNL